MNNQSKPVPAAWEIPLKLWRQSLAAAARSKKTIETRLDHGRRFARAMQRPPGQVTDAEVMAGVANQNWPQETRRSVYASLRAFYGWAISAGICQRSPVACLPSVPAAAPHVTPAPELAYRRALAEATPPLQLPGVTYNYLMMLCGGPWQAPHKTN